MSSNAAPQRHLTQMRPPGGGPAYAPQRDLAYIYSPAVQEAFWLLSHPEHWPVDLAKWMLNHDIGAEDLAEAMKRFADAHTLFTGETEIKAPWDALKQTGFTDLPYDVQMAVFQRLGEVLTGGFFVACRDVTGYYDVPPPEVQMINMIAEGRAISIRMQMAHHEEPDTALTIEGLRAELAQAKKAVALKDEELRGHKLRDGHWKRYRREREQNIQDALAYITELEKRSWWRRLLNKGLKVLRIPLPLPGDASTESGQSPTGSSTQ